MGDTNHPTILEVTFRAVNTKPNGAGDDKRPTWGFEQPKDFMGYYYSGEFTITFDKPLYSVTLVGGQYVRKEVWAVPSGRVDDSDKQVSIMDVIDFPTGNLELFMAENKGPSQTFRFKFTDFVPNDYVAFFANSGVANASSSRPGNQQVVLTFDPTITNKEIRPDSFQQDFYVGGFRVSTRTI